MINEIEYQQQLSGRTNAILRNQYGDVTVSLYGGQVISYRPTGQSEVFYLSDKAEYITGKAIRGGAPICWPWFGQDIQRPSRGSHGFARTQPWQVIGSEHTSAGETVLRLALRDSMTTLAIWPYHFLLQLEIRLGASLQLTLTTHNTGSQPFFYTQAIHSYFQIGDIHTTTVSGLDGISYLDKTLNFTTQQQQGVLKIDKEIDRIYLQPPSKVTLSARAQLQIESEGSATTVVWNPWEAASRKLSDMAQDDYQRFLCIETANAAKDEIRLMPGKQHRLVARYQVVAS